MEFVVIHLDNSSSLVQATVTSIETFHDSHVLDFQMPLQNCFSMLSALCCLRCKTLVRTTANTSLDVGIDMCLHDVVQC